MRRITIANQKGGCGKTATAVSLSLCLKNMGKKILLMDMDPQGSATQSLYPDNESLEHTIHDLLVNSDSVPLSQVIQKIDSELDLVPANVVLSTAEQILAGANRREERLKMVTDRVDNDYEFIIIDSPPNIGLLTFNALMAADEVIIPVDPSLFSLHGVGRVVEALDLLRSVNDHHVTYRVLATMYDSRTRISREILSTIKDRFADSSFKTVIRSNITLKESTGFGVPITHYRASRGFYDYRSLAGEILGHEPTQKPLDFEIPQNVMAPRRIGGGILFSYLDNEADAVYLEGDFNSWDGKQDVLLEVDGRGLWQRVVTLRPGPYKYRFVKDNRPITDPNNDRTEYLEGKGMVSVIEV